MEDSKQKKNGKSFLKKIAMLLYILAFISLIAGIFQMSSHFSSSTDLLLTDGRLQSVISSFFSVFVLFIWGSVFMFIANSKLLKQKIEQKRVEQEEQLRMRQQTQNLGIKQEQKKRYFCVYCDNELNENDRKCPYCGASKKIQK